MDVHDLDAAFQEVLDGAGSDAGSFEDAWQYFQELVREKELLDRPALLAEFLLDGAPDAGILKAVQNSAGDTQGSKTRRSMFKWLLALLQELEPGKLQQYVPVIFDSMMLRVKASAKAEDVATKVAAVEMLSFILHQEASGLLQPHLSPDDALNRATQLQRVCLSSDARNSKTLKPAFLGVIGLLLQLSALASQQQQQQQQAPPPAAAAAGGSSAEQLQIRAEQLRWLLQLCEQELGATRGAGAGAAVAAGTTGARAPPSLLSFDAGQASEGSIQGLTAVLSVMRPGDAGEDHVQVLSAALDLVAVLMQELAAMIDSNQKPRLYGKYTAAMQLLQQLGPQMATAGLLQPPAAPVPATQPSAATAAGGVSLGLLRSLLAVSAASSNASVKKSASAALAELSELMCEQLLKLDACAPAALEWLDQGIGLCSAHLARGGGAAAGSGSGWTRGALEVLGRLTPAVMKHQGLKVWRTTASSVWLPG